MNLDTVKPYAKAIVAFITPGVTGLVGAVQDSSPGGSNIIGPEWVGIFAACVLTAGAVFGVPNKDPLGVKQDESVQPPDAPAVVVESAGPDYPIAQDFVGGTTPPPTTEPDKGGYWGGV